MEKISLDVYKSNQSLSTTNFTIIINNKPLTRCKNFSFVIDADKDMAEFYFKLIVSESVLKRFDCTLEDLNKLPQDKVLSMFLGPKATISSEKEGCKFFSYEIPKDLINLVVKLSYEIIPRDEKYGTK